MNGSVPLASRRNDILNTRIDRLVSGLVLGVMIFALIKPDSLPYIGLGWLETALIGLDAVVLLVLFVFLLSGRIGFNPITVALVCMWICLAISTALESQDYLQLLKTAGPATCTCLLTDYMMRRNPGLFLGACARALALFYTINAVTIVLYYPEGLYSTDWVTGDCYFMGFDNGMIYGLLPMCVYATCYSLRAKGRVFSSLPLYCICLALFSVCYVKAATGIIVMVIFTALLIWREKTCDNGIIKPLVLLPIFFIATLLLVIFHIQTYFSGTIYDLFSKDATLSGRTYLWDYAMSLISQQPLIGYGATTRAIVGTNGHIYPHPHCLVLDMLYRGGIPMFLAFIAVIVAFSLAYYKAKKGLARDAILIGAFALLVGEVAGSTQFKPLFYGLFALMGHCCAIEQKQQGVELQTPRKHDGLLVQPGDLR